MKRPYCLDEKWHNERLQVAGALLLVLATTLFAVNVIQAEESTAVPVIPDPLPLLNALWELCPQNRCDVAPSGQASTPSTAVFTSAGLLSGFSGCNKFWSSYTVEGSNMSVGALSSTRMLCEEEVMVEEQAYLQALRDTVTYDIHTDSLVLYAADGVVLATFETEDTRLRVFIPYIMGQ